MHAEADTYRVGSAGDASRYTSRLDQRSPPSPTQQRYEDAPAVAATGGQWILEAGVNVDRHEKNYLY